MDTTNLPKSRSEAKASGAKYYFTGEPCKHGHIAPRKTKGICVECMKAESKAALITRADYYSAYNKSEAGQKAKRDYYSRNRDAVIARASARPAEEKRRLKNNHKKQNSDYYKTLVSLRRRRYRDATPPWLTREQKAEIRQLYQIAITMTRTTGERYAVDHIVPLYSESVCGLHVPWNLRVITQEENLKKSNKLPLDSPSPSAYTRLD